VVPWNPEFNAMAYALLGRGTVGEEQTPVAAHDLAVFGSGDTVIVRAADTPSGDDDALEVLLLGGQPIREPIAHYGPFLMNTEAEILEAIEDFQNGKMGAIPDDAR
jgi:redox-sensitive bicupin YhaK (pirin superfamily)